MVKSIKQNKYGHKIQDTDTGLQLDPLGTIVMLGAQT